MSERNTFLRAIAEQPADRTARLVFADFLEETGDAADAVRAAFVRAQVEAETVHSNSNRHAELEARAEELFAKHWLDWWAVHTAAVGLPLPQRPSAIRTLVTRLAGGVQRPGRPYKRRWPTAVGLTAGHDGPLGALHRVEYEGGFPEVVTLLGTPGFAADFLRRWFVSSPLAVLDLRGVVGRDWRALDGPHLSGLRALRLSHSAAAGLEALAGSPHLDRLESLRLDPDRSSVRWPAELYRALANSPLAGRVTRLSVVLSDVSESLALHGAPLNNLTALEVRAPRSLSTREEFGRAAQGAADLLALPHLDRLEELALDATASYAIGAADRALLGRLRKLELTISPWIWDATQFNTWILPPALTDLSLTVPDWSAHWLQVLTKSSFVGRLQHLHLDGNAPTTPDRIAGMMRLIRALDADRLETLRLGTGVCPSPDVRAALVEKFGARFRLG